MGKTRRNELEYKNFVDTDKNNLIVVKQGKIIEQVKTFQGEDMFVVQKPNTYVGDSGVIVKTSTDNQSSIDFVGIPNNVYLNAGGQITGTANVSPSSNGVYIQLSGGQTPYQTINYTFGSSSGVQSGTSPNASFGLNLNYNTTNQCYYGGQYNFNATTIDANGDTVTWSWGNYIAGTCTTSTPSTISGLTASATAQGNSSIKCDANWNGGVTPYVVTYSLYKVTTSPTLVGTPISQSVTGTFDSYTALNLTSGQYVFEVKVTDSNNNTQTVSSNTITLSTGAAGSGNIQTVTSVTPLANLNINAQLIINDDIQCDVDWVGGVAPYVVKYYFYKDNILISTTPTNTSQNSDSLLLQTNSNPGTYKIKVEIIDTNNDIIDATSQSITIQPNVVTPTSLPLSGLTVSASIVGTNNNQLKCNASWNNGTSPFTITYSLYKDNNLLGSIAPQSTTTNSDSYTSSNLNDGNYKYKVVVSDGQNSLTAFTQSFNIVNPPSAPPTPPTPPTPTTTPPSSNERTSSGTFFGGTTILSGMPQIIERETIIETNRLGNNKWLLLVAIGLGAYLLLRKKD